MPYTPPSVGRAGPDRPRQHAARTTVPHPAGLPSDRAAGRSQRLGQALQRHPLPDLHQLTLRRPCATTSGANRAHLQVAQERGGPSLHAARAERGSRCGWSGG